MRNVFWFSILATLVACGGGSGAESAEEAGSEETGGGEAAYAGPIGSTDVAAGQEVFAMFCDDCHPDGEEDVGPSLIGHPEEIAEIRQQVREGSGKMRPFSAKRLSDEQLEQLLAYMDSIGAVEK